MASTSGLGDPDGLVTPQRNKPSTDHLVQLPKRPRDSPDRDVTALKRARPNSDDDDDDDSMDCKVLDSPDLYTIAWIATLSIEAAAATAMLDKDTASQRASADIQKTITFTNGAGVDPRERSSLTAEITRTAELVT